MTKRIQQDHKRFRDVISGRKRKELKRLIKSGGIVRTRPKGGKVTVSIPEIEIPRFVHGTNGSGVGRGPGKIGQTVGRDPKKGEKGNKAGDQPGEGIQIQLDLDEVLQFMSEELSLPRMKPKPNETFEEIKIKYNNISKNGPESLRHTRRTMIEGLKRRAAMGKLNDPPKKVPGSKVPINVLELINSDRRYRQYTEVKMPSSNAVIMFARDCSMSMDENKCEIVSDMSWWLDCWIRKYYEKVQRCYFVHDTLAKEVGEETFYGYRYGGGTICSSAFKLMSEQLENRFPPAKHNIYLFYFTDGENWGGDNDKILEILEKDLTHHKVNLIGITQVCSWRYQGSVKNHIDDALKVSKELRQYVNTASIGPETDESEEGSFGYFGSRADLTEDARNKQIIDAIRDVLSSESLAVE